MATFRLYSDIVGEEERVLLQKFGLGGHCYKDINEFLTSMPKDDDVIDIRIHCRGGNCVEGWAMYDALRRSKKKIYATVEGECSSMATIILLAAPLERRTAYKNAHFCIHNPSVEYLDTDIPKRLTADGLNTLRSQMGIQEETLREEQSKILDLYVQRTKASRGELQQLMNKDTFINTARAMELGFISRTLVPNTAKKNYSLTNSIDMSKPQTTVAVKKSLLDRMLAMCGLAKIEDVKMRDQVVTSSDGREFTVEREDGDPQIGDVAYPDGTYTMEDGTQIVIEDNLIISVEKPREAEEVVEEIADPDDPNAKTEAAPAETTEVVEEAPVEEDVEEEEKSDERDEKIAELETRVAELETRIAELEAERENLQNEVASKKDARILSEEETSILACVASNGGKEWLDGVTALRSTFHAQNRRFVDHSPIGQAPEGESKTQKAIREQRERYASFKK